MHCERKDGRRTVGAALRREKNVRWPGSGRGVKPLLQRMEFDGETSGLHFFGYHVGLAIHPFQQGVCLRIIGEFFVLAHEAQGAAGAIGDVG